ncbi:hypothetical protein QIS99_16430 [Streptomyces sp. B-S-A8]|uniref:A-factor biosynthesis hotdog domain-containing protein n=1 Tax=Streptomyces solicavernae TaxID=3043614 RepID=A0ABT6RTS2_9ACTN|nr:AfsA-related hotdog domain-containing protein [Streptomyces sp. B-S-A8]MDI3387775.1 hypothetical protein [Streptomyces sp. B-S-A8]
MDGVSVEGQRVRRDAPGSPGTSGGPSAGPAPARIGPAPGQPQTPVPWTAIGLPTMASMLVVSLGRTGSRSFTARCQWPRLHPLNERSAEVRHHPLIMVESARQLALAVERRHLLGEDAPAFVPASVGLGLRPGVQPQERDAATDVEALLVLSDLAAVRDRLTAYRITAEFRHRGAPFASCTMRLAAPARPRAASRADGPGPAGLLHPPAAAVGAAADGDVLVARAPQGRMVLLPRDPAHPVLLPGRPDRLPAPAVLEAARQATLLRSGRTADAVVGLSVDLRAPVPSYGAVIEVESEAAGSRFLVTAARRAVATGSVMLGRP